MFRKIFVKYNFKNYVFFVLLYIIIYILWWEEQTTDTVGVASGLGEAFIEQK